MFLVNWGPPVAVMMAILYFSSRSVLPAALSAQTPSGEMLRDTIHVLEYAALGFAGFRAWYRAQLKNSSPWSTVLVALTFGLLFAIADELHQKWIPNRDASMGDVAADAIGISIGVLCGIGYAFLRARARLLPDWV